MIGCPRPPTPCLGAGSDDRNFSSDLRKISPVGSRNLGTRFLLSRGDSDAVTHSPSHLLQETSRTLLFPWCWEFLCFEDVKASGGVLHVSRGLALGRSFSLEPFRIWDLFAKSLEATEVRHASAQ